MFNLKIGDIVMHKGVKRRVSHIVPIFGQHLLILDGFPYMVRSRDVKPIIRVSATLYPWGPPMKSDTARDFYNAKH